MKVDKYTTLAEFVFYIDILKPGEKIIEDLFSRLKSYPIPDIFHISFNELKFKQLIDIQSRVKTFDDMIFIPFEVIHDLSREDVISMGAFDCLRFALFAKDELERITKLFKSIEYKPSAEEQRAGIGNLSHGFFGTIDWYARRMGIANHDDVVELKWTRIYQCLKIDYDNNNFERRYRKIIEKK